MGFIKTDGVDGGSVETEPEAGWDAGEWSRNHFEKVQEGSVASERALKTTWTITPSGDTKRVLTARLPSETDTAFKNRHIINTLERMLDCPPVA